MTTAANAGTSIPAAKKVSTAKPPAPPAAAKAAPASTGNSLSKMVEALEKIELTNQHDVHSFLETNRQLAHMLAVTSAMASGELEASIKATARSGAGKLGILGPGMLLQLRRVTRKINRIADDYAAAAADAVGAWAEFQKILDSVEDADRPGAARKGFSIV